MKPNQTQITFPTNNNNNNNSNNNSPPLPPPPRNSDIRRKISLPSLNSASTLFTNPSQLYRAPPPVPPLPTNYYYNNTQPQPQQQQQQQPASSSSSSNSFDLNHQQRPTNSSSSFSSQSPLNIFKRSAQHNSSRSISSHLNFSQSSSSSSSSSSSPAPPPPATNHPASNSSSPESRLLRNHHHHLRNHSPNNEQQLPPIQSIRPLPHLPPQHQQHHHHHQHHHHLPQSPNSLSTNNNNSTIPSLPEPSPSSSNSRSVNRISALGASYTSLLHDYDQPLGAHSIPIRIGTRPICFNSSSPSSSSTAAATATEPRPSLSSELDQTHYASEASLQQDQDRKPIIPADRDLILSGHSLWHEQPQQQPLTHHHHQQQQHDNNTIPLQIYTTRPSLDSNRDHRPRRSTSFDELRPNHQPTTALTSSLSIERTPNNNNRKQAITRGETKMSHILLEPGFNIAYLSHVAKFLQDHVPRDTKIKGNIEYPMSFTGRDAVTIITHCLNRVNPSTKSTTQATLNRKLALSLSRALLAEQFFHEVTNLNHEVCLNDNIDEVYIFPHVNQHHHSWIHHNSSSSSASSSSASSSAIQDYSLSHSLTRSHLPQGVLTSLTKCYSFSCQMASSNPNNTLLSLCYSYDCPLKKNRTTSLHHPPTLLPAPSLPEASPTPSVVQTKDWASVVSKDLISSLDSKEIARQSIIYELISGEQEYVQDLDDYEKLFIIPLVQANPPILPPQRLPEFKEKVVSNVLEIRDHNRVLLQNLLIRQQDQHPLVKAIGDVILNSALEWGQDYIRYTSDHVFGEVEVNDEKTRNPSFAELMNKIPKVSPRRADFKHYHSRAFVRLQRYNLLLESLLRKTPDGHEDRASIEDAMEVIRRQCKEADQAVSLQQAKLHLVRLNNEIVTKSDTPDLQLLSPNRQLIFSGKMLRKPEGGTGLSEWSELQVMLFDHYFLMTKVKRLDEHNQRYHLSRPPVMLELMRVTGFNDPCERKSRGLRTITGTLGSNGGLERGNSDPYSASPVGPGGSAAGTPAADDRWLFPITVQSLGRNSYSSTMYVDSERLRLVWKAKFEEAIGLRLQILDSFKVFDLYPMTDQTFAASGSVASHSTPPAGHVNGSGLGGSAGSVNASSGSLNPPSRAPTVGETLSNMHGPPTCSVPFRSSDGKRLIAIGCQDGLWIGLRNDPGSMKQVIYLKSITQCAVLQEFGFLLVLAEKILMAYPLDSLIPSRSSPAVHPHNHSSHLISSNSSRTSPVRAIASRLSGNKDVLFFRCGKVGPRTLVIYVKKGGVNQTVFKALEPVRNSENAQVTSRRGFFGIGGNRSDSFRGYKEFFVPSESYAIQYLRNTLTIHCARGFEIMNIDTLKTASIPDFNQIKQQDARLVALQRRCDESRPLGMFRLGDNEFLLCYDEFAFFADKHGDPLIDRYNAMMEWDGRPSTVAYHAPYVICFSGTMIEVWNTISSQRVQIILGQSIQCTYDGGGLGDDGSHSRTILIDSHSHPARPAPSSSSSTPTPNPHDDDEGERRVHVMMKDNDQFYRVFEMVPLTLH
ncbi:hypothetical protein PGT21_006695 [Puccinia graminis f. sp. tritici]|uniref:RHO1 GDP-GTP exchange protein 2 n=1 Tax=Puccinia graminis f. sp. tritici TaxID=56615 RepID=A0A5B0QHM1_PUCGR|nr:hypothetical protein PGT21_006695 [Puccinia graminis f. sp. tritici]